MLGSFPRFWVCRAAKIIYFFLASLLSLLSHALPLSLSLFCPAICLVYFRIRIPCCWVFVVAAAADATAVVVVVLVVDLFLSLIFANGYIGICIYKRRLPC